MSEAVVTEVRCPSGAQRLFTKLRLREAVIIDGNLIEFGCHDCRKRLNREGGAWVEYVLHRYNMVGELVETVVVRG
jgi:hypothetical protein